MASSLLRGTILRRIRSQTLTLNGCGSSFRSLSSDSGHADPTDDEIISSASLLIKRAEYTIRRRKYTGIVYRSLYIMGKDSIFNTCSQDTKLKVLSRVFDLIRNYPEADSREVFLMNIYIRSMSNDDSKNDITKDEVVSRVLDVIRSYPKVGHYKVTEETHFHKDLGFDEFDCIEVSKALYMEFKLYVPMKEVVSCKLAIDYIYDNRMKRESFEDFRKANRTGGVFWPVSKVYRNDISFKLSNQKIRSP